MPRGGKVRNTIVEAWQGGVPRGIRRAGLPGSRLGGPGPLLLLDSRPSLAYLEPEDTGSCQSLGQENPDLPPASTLVSPCVSPHLLPDSEPIEGLLASYPRPPTPDLVGSMSGIGVFCLFFLTLFRASPVAYGGFQARGRITAYTALHHSHSNAGSKWHL